MPRKQQITARRGPTENEIALQWELKRLRAELAALRKAQESEERANWKPEPLEGLPRAHLMMKVERISRRIVKDHIHSKDLCPQCGGVSFAQHENAFRDYVKRLGLDLDDESQKNWPYKRDELAEPQQWLPGHDKPEETLYATAENEERAHEDHNH